MKPSDLSEFFNLLGKAKKEKEEEFDNLLKEADINLDDLTSSLVSGIKEAKEDQKKQKKKEEKLIEQLDSIIDVIENPKEVKDITEPAVTVGVPEDFDVTTLEDADDNETVEIIDIIKPEPIKTPEISDTVAQAIKFIEETNIKEEIENSDDTNLDKLKTEIKQVRDILYKVLAHGPGSGEVNLLKLDDVDEDSAKVDGRFLKYDASSGKFVGGSGGAGSQNLDDTLGLGNTSVLGISVGVITATSFVGDGNGLLNLNASATGWEQVASGLGTGIYNSAQTNVGVGTTIPRFNLHLGGPGFARTALFVEGNSIFHAGIAASDLTVGVITANNFRLNNSSTGHINAGIVTTGNLIVGTSGTIITTSSGQIGFGTVVPRSPVDIESRLRLKSYHEAVDSVSSASNNVNIDLSRAQNFTLTTTENVSQFTLLNTPDEVTTFTIKIVQGSTGRNVGIDTFKNSGGDLIPIYWPGGVLPVVTVGAGKSDIYSFKSFDGCSTLYGVVGGQNFG